jgi:folylpolyglutamate synthase/dihydropteroate synthase
VRLCQFHLATVKAGLEYRCAQPCALRAGLTSVSIGLYTSPHMIAVRERVRINGTPLSETDFAKFFFEVWDRLGENDVVYLFLLFRNAFL